ncbi:MAG: nitrate/nitrite transporter [Candidatus Bathyarchaeia archaeon]
MIRGYKLGALILTPLGFFTLGLSMVSYSMMAETVVVELGLSYGESGLVMSILWLSYAVMQIPGGMLSDRWGGGKVMVLSAAVLGVAGLAFVTSDSFATALLTRMVMGVAGGLILPAAVKVISSTFAERELDLAMGIFASGWGASQIVAFTIVPIFITIGTWRIAALFVGVFALCAAVAFTYLWKGAHMGSEPRRAARPQLRKVFTMRLTGLGLNNFAGLAVMMGVATWAPFFLMSKFNMPTQDAGLIIAVVGVTNILASFIGGVAAVKLGRARVVVIAMLMYLLLPVALVYSPTSSWAFFIIAGVGWATMFYAPAMFAWVPSSTPLGKEGAGTAFGVLNTMSNVGPFLSPFIMGYTLDFTSSYPLAFLGLASLATVGVAGVILVLLRSGGWRALRVKEDS